ncbi:LysR family transcriptional regulator [Actinomyces massiliensis]|uniref:LysR family transcriptional regulator n=1 Tax=Actinomyces massiliensis TaxID=461393 RepID=UPI0002DE2E9C|nr:LysR family transcriptional regulator [Actinomyces massiliensis]
MNDRLSFEGLRYAQAVARTGSFSAAAREYDLTQPALSNAIRRLEKILGARLFERNTRGARPTVFGATILPRIDAALAALDAITAEARHWRAGEPRPVRIGVSPLISADVVARAHSAVAGLLGRGRGSFVLREADLSELCTALDDDELDLIVVPAVLPLTRYRHHVTGSEPVVLVEPGAGDAAGPVNSASPTDPTRAADPANSADPVGSADPASPAEVRAAAARIDDVARRTLLLVPDTCGLTTFTRDLLADRGLPLRAYSGEAASYRVLEDWAGMGLGSALLPRSKVTRVDSSVRPVVDARGAVVTIAYEAAWDGASPIAGELEALAELLAS